MLRMIEEHPHTSQPIEITESTFRSIDLRCWRVESGRLEKREPEAEPRCRRMENAGNKENAGIE
jgi:hypothetical protein